MPEKAEKYTSRTLANTLYRRVTYSHRRLSRSRRAVYRIAVPTARLLLRLVWGLCPVRKVLGEHYLHAVLDRDSPVIPVCWHQHQLFCVRYLLQQRHRGLRPGFLISPSVDGEAPAQLVHSMGGWVIRGSSTRTGARALREIYMAIRTERVSPLMMPDGPRGPAFEFKPGAILLSQLSRVPLVPFAYAARHACVLRTWDRFVVPLPGTPIAIAVGEPVEVDRHLSAERLQALQEEMARRLRRLFVEARDSLA